MTADEKARFQTMENKVSEIDKKLDRLLFVIQGDGFNQNMGTVSEVKNIRKDVDKLLNFKNRLVWFAMGAGFAAGITVDKVWFIISKILH